MEQYFTKSSGFIAAQMVGFVFLLTLAAVIMWAIFWPTDQASHDSWVSVGGSPHYQIDLEEDGKQGVLKVFGPDQKISRQSPVSIEKINETVFLVSVEGKKLKFFLGISGLNHVLTCHDCNDQKPPLAPVWQIKPR